MGFYSQCNQDSFLEESVFKGFKNGVFMDVGAHDGVSLNNTLFFEQTHNWSGVNVEPLPEIYNRLKINRPNCINLNLAVSNTNGNAEFLSNTGYTEMLSGLKSEFDDRHLNRISLENISNGGNSQIIPVETKRIETICDENNIKHIHYLSIDVEGAEFEVIKSINFEKVFIDLIDFENNYDDVSQPIINYLTAKGYIVLAHYTDIFMIHKDSIFRK